MIGIGIVVVEKRDTQDCVKLVLTNGEQQETYLLRSTKVVQPGSNPD